MFHYKNLKKLGIGSFDSLIGIGKKSTGQIFCFKKIHFDESHIITDIVN
jgi:hypothetical protein